MGFAVFLHSSSSPPWLPYVWTEASRPHPDRSSRSRAQTRNFGPLPVSESRKSLRRYWAIGPSEPIRSGWARCMRARSPQH